MIQDDINAVEYSYLYHIKIFDQKTYDFIEDTHERDYLLHTHKGLQHTVSTLSSLVECCWHYSIYILETLNLMQFDSLIVEKRTTLRTVLFKLFNKKFNRLLIVFVNKLFKWFLGYPWVVCKNKILSICFKTLW